MQNQEEFNNMIKSIFKDGKIKKIKWGEDFLSWDIETQLEFAKNLAAAMNQSAELMQDEKNKMVQEVKLAESKVEAAQQQVDIQKQIVMTNLTESNERNQEYITEIQKLQSRIAAQDKVIEKLNGNNS